VSLKIYSVTHNSFGCFLLKYSEKGEDKESKGRCVCCAGAGIDVTKGKGDTKGFPLQSKAAIVQDLRGFIDCTTERTEELFKVQLGWFKVDGQIRIFRFSYMIAILVLPAQKKLQELLTIS
jgi:hypothetical protein